MEPKKNRLGLQQTFCGDKADCHLTTLFEGARDASGERGLIVSLPTQLEATDSRCEGLQIWGVRLASDDTVVERQAVGTGCREDTPYGGACDGLNLLNAEKPTAEEPNVFSVDWQAPGPGCGGWLRQSGGVRVSLDTLRVLTRNEWAGRAAAPDDSHGRAWDFTSFVFTSEWQTDNGDCPSRSRQAFGIPRLALDAALKEHVWESASWDNCATTFDDKNGVALPGTRRAKARIKAVVTESELLLIDVADTDKAARGASLQVCAAPWTSQEYGYCQMALTPTCARVALDGRMLSGEPLITRAPDKTRFRMQLPAETTAVTVAYLDGAGGSLASSTFVAGDATSLGSIFPLGAGVVKCEHGADGFRISPAARREERELLATDDLD